MRLTQLICRLAASDGDGQKYNFVSNVDDA